MLNFTGSYTNEPTIIGRQVPGKTTIMIISFIIPHKGRKELLQATILSIAAQTYDLAQAEIIVVTQNKELSVNELLPDEDVKTSIVFRPESDTISALRNRGADIATGTHLAFLDADVKLSPNWIVDMLSELSLIDDRVLVSAVQRCSESAPPLEKIRTALSNASTDSNVDFLPGRNLLLTKETYSRAGGFPEHLVTCEDYYFTNKVHNIGHLYYSSKADYVHLGEDKKYKEMFDKEIWRGQSNLQSIKGRPIPLSEYPSFIVPIWILFFFIATPLLILAGEPEISFIAFSLVCLPIALYSIRLYKVAGGTVRFYKIVQFYFAYFPARILGTFLGLFKVINI